MSKAEDRALEAYPIVISQHSDNCKEYDSNESDRLTFIEGYHQAEKDLELTWEDIREIYCTTLNLREHLGASVFGEPLYQEVLKQFKDFRERKQK